MTVGPRDSRVPEFLRTLREIVAKRSRATYIRWVSRCALRASIASIRREPQDTVFDKLAEDPRHSVGRYGEKSARLVDRQGNARHFLELALNSPEEGLTPDVIPTVS